VCNGTQRGSVQRHAEGKRAAARREGGVQQPAKEDVQRHAERGACNGTQKVGCATACREGGGRATARRGEARRACNGTQRETVQRHAEERPGGHATAGRGERATARRGEAGRACNGTQRETVQRHAEERPGGHATARRGEAGGSCNGTQKASEGVCRVVSQDDTKRALV
jgi:hypothetical protein